MYFSVVSIHPQIIHIIFYTNHAEMTLRKQLSPLGTGTLSLVVAGSSSLNQGHASVSPSVYCLVCICQIGTISFLILSPFKILAFLECGKFHSLSL